MPTEVNESETLVKHMPCNCGCGKLIVENVIQSKNLITARADVSVKIQ